MTRTLKQLANDAAQTGPAALRAASRLMSHMTDQPQQLAELLAVSQQWPQPRLVLGITGAPGSGKSAFVDAVVTNYRELFPARRIGVVAVDPSSPFTGGALLGDRIRRMRHAIDPHVFIRSLASRGQLGGLALGVKGVIRVMGLVGCDVVIVETVGVGQSEIDIAHNSDLTAVVLAPGQGDSIQLLKAGLMEAGDLFVVNKSDRPDAVRLHQELLAALHMMDSVTAGRRPGAPNIKGCRADGNVELDRCERTFLCSALANSGVTEFIDAVEGVTSRYSDAWKSRRRAQAIDELKDAVVCEISSRVRRLLESDADLGDLMEQLSAGRMSIGDLATEITTAIADAPHPHVAKPRFLEPVGAPTTS